MPKPGGLFSGCFPPFERMSLKVGDSLYTNQGLQILDSCDSVERAATTMI